MVCVRLTFGNWSVHRYRESDGPVCSAFFRCREAGSFSFLPRGAAINLLSYSRQMKKSYSYKCFVALGLIAFALPFTGCQQAPAPAAAAATPGPAQAPPATTVESTSETKSVGVKPADPSNPDSPAVKTTSTDTTLVKKKP